MATSKNLNIPTGPDTLRLCVQSLQAILHIKQAGGGFRDALLALHTRGWAFDRRKSDQTKGITRVLHHRIDHSILKYILFLETTLGWHIWVLPIFKVPSSNPKQCVDVPTIVV